MKTAHRSALVLLALLGTLVFALPLLHDHDAGSGHPDCAACHLEQVASAQPAGGEGLLLAPTTDGEDLAASPRPASLAAPLYRPPGRAPPAA